MILPLATQRKLAEDRYRFALRRVDTTSEAWERDPDNDLKARAFRDVADELDDAAAICREWMVPGQEAIR